MMNVSTDCLLTCVVVVVVVWPRLPRPLRDVVHGVSRFSTQVPASSISLEIIIHVCLVFYTCMYSIRFITHCVVTAYLNVCIYPF